MKPHDNPDPAKVKFSDRLRSNQTFFERSLWRKLKKNVAGAQVWRQTVIHSYIVDFYLPDYYLAIELDGGQHDEKRDSRRDAILFNKGITVMRFRNPKTVAETNDVFCTIYAEVKHRQRKRNGKSPTNPQDLSEQTRGYSGLYKGKNSKPRTDEPCGNVEIKGCQEQAFACEEVAENFVRSLKERGIESTVLRCLVCGMIHVRRKDG